MIPLDASLSALQSLQRAQANVAHNVANSMTPGFQSAQAVFQPTPSGGVSVNLKQTHSPYDESPDDFSDEPPDNDVDLAHELTQSLIYRRAFQANAAVIRTLDETAGNFLDIIA
ncbi:hypothetical protein JXA32_02215 [Candidatus Sumerlaeota bacterium]|nr:hypothetical protein [Candidatus Sumerlaeota bacterium]